MTISGHIVKSYDQELAYLVLRTTQMGAAVEEQLQKALHALHSRDNELTLAVYEGDNAIDAMETEINDHALQILALRQPMAGDLRLIIGSMKIARDFERIGDYAANLAKRSYALNTASKLTLNSALLRLGTLVAPMLQDALAAYSNNDTAKADTVCDNDASIDEAYNEVVETIVAYMQQYPDSIKLCTHILFMAKNIERIGDRCTNIAETIHFIVAGNQPPEQRRPNRAEKLRSGAMDF